MKIELKKMLISVGVLVGLLSHIYFNNHITENVYSFIVILSWATIPLYLVIIPGCYLIVKDHSDNEEKLKTVRDFVKKNRLISSIEWVTYAVLLYMGNVWLITISVILSLISKGYSDDLRGKLKEIDSSM